MKKFITLICLLFVVGISAKTFAQSTGTTPSPGATHTYSVTANSGSTYVWSVTKDDESTDAGSDASLSATTGDEISITWGTGVNVGDWYYVHVVETNSGCTNEKVLPVQITASPFFLTLDADNANGCYDDAVDVTITSNAPVYDHGTATVSYTISPTGVNASSNGYSFDFDLAGNLPDGYSTAAPTVKTGSATIASSTVTVTDINSVTLEFVITNANEYNNSNDADGDAADFTATLNISAGKTGNGVSDNGNGVDEDGTAISRPHTPAIQTN